MFVCEIEIIYSMHFHVKNVSFFYGLKKKKDKINLYTAHFISHTAYGVYNGSHLNKYKK